GHREGYLPDACSLVGPDLQAEPVRRPSEENDILTSPAGVHREPSDFAVDLRVQPEPVFLVCVHPKLVFRVIDQYTETASQDVNERSHGLAPGSSDVASFSSSSLPVPGEAFVELRPSASGPTLVRFR